MLHPLVHELDRQPVEQFGMRRRLALRAEVLARLDEAAAEQRFPEPVHRHARRRAGCRGSRASAPARAGSAARRRGSGGSAVGVSAYTSSPGAWTPPLAQVNRRPLERRLLFHHQRRRYLQRVERLRGSRDVGTRGLELRRQRPELRRARSLAWASVAARRAAPRARRACERRGRPTCARWLRVRDREAEAAQPLAESAVPHGRPRTVNTVPPGRPTRALARATSWNGTRRLRAGVGHPGLTSSRVVAGESSESRGPRASRCRRRSPR